MNCSASGVVFVFNGLRYLKDRERKNVEKGRSVEE